MTSPSTVVLFVPKRPATVLVGVGGRQGPPGEAYRRPLKSFPGVVGDGAHDDTAGIIDALGSGERLTGKGLSYKVTADLVPSSSSVVVDLADATVVRTNAQPTTKVVQFNGNTVRLSNIKIDRGADKASGSGGPSAGLWVSGGTGHDIDRIEVVGHGLGSGVVLQNCQGSFRRINVHDMEFDSLAAADDVMVGISIEGVDDSVFELFRVSDLFGNGGNAIWGITAGTRTPLYTRGISWATGNRCIMIAPHTFGTGEAIDLTGGANKYNNQLIGGMADTPMGYGLKIFGDHTTRRTIVTGLMVRRPGLPGIIVGHGASFVQIENCLVEDAGYLSYGTTPALTTYGYGYWVGHDTVAPDTQGVVFRGCRAIDTQAVSTMKWGFGSEVVYDSALARNALDGCETFGATLGHQVGFAEPRCRVTRPGSFSVATATPTLINYTAVEDYDSMGMHPNATSPNVVTPAAEPGAYFVSTSITFAGNATGTRMAEILADGTVVATASQPGNAAGNTVKAFALIDASQAPATVNVRATQTSGVGLQVASPYLQVEKL